jgi:peptide/nickel transport system permease protein
VGAVFERDYPVIMGVNMMVAGVVITANLLTDLAYCLIDPRISYK